jgi:hypothetical protein
MNTPSATQSMRKSTLALAAAAGLFALTSAATAVVFGGSLGLAVSGLFCFAALLLAALAWAGNVVQARQSRVETGQPDLFLLRNAGRSEAAVRDGKVPAWGRSRRWLARHGFGHRLMVGDRVRVKSLDQIRATLDAEGCLDGLPFMDEMAAFCGQSLSVYRVVDKIYDYGRSRLMRRLDDCVLLLGQRCDGSAHRGCEAACYLIWKSAWLDAPDAAPRTAVTVSRPARPAADGDVLRCQYTQLTQASRAIVGADVGGLVGPLVAGNVSAAAFSVAVATRVFNRFQNWRGGATYPSKPLPSDDKTIRGESLSTGDWVRVKSPAEIARAMDRNSKNRGLWFDRDMLKHCGQTYRVRGRVEKIIDVGSGKIIPMKTPCIVLDDVHYSGEFQGFGEQHDFLYWREAWLNRIAPATEPDR